ncbi:MAG: ankyrin repeat domain-containing protein [Endozoicomonadaceae bacterium]|nr:ankyrin repeat domain-containing protein [Endozoicomonadaceae bacterium]
MYIAINNSDELITALQQQSGVGALNVLNEIKKASSPFIEVLNLIAHINYCIKNGESTVLGLLVEHASLKQHMIYDIGKYAIETDNLQLFKQLPIEQGDLINLNRLLENASKQRKHSILEYLITLNSVNKEMIYGCLLITTKNDDLETVLFLLKKGTNPNPDPNTKFMSHPAICEAATNGNVAMLQLFLSHGANSTHTDGMDRSALEAAVCNNKKEALIYLLTREVKIKTQLYSAARIALRSSDIQLMECFVHYNGPFDIKDCFSDVLETLICCGNKHDLLNYVIDPVNAARTQDILSLENLIAMGFRIAKDVQHFLYTALVNNNQHVIDTVFQHGAKLCSNCMTYLINNHETKQVENLLSTMIQSVPSSEVEHDLKMLTDEFKDLSRSFEHTPNIHKFMKHAIDSIESASSSLILAKSFEQTVIHNSSNKSADKNVINSSGNSL